MVKISLPNRFARGRSTIQLDHISGLQADNAWGSLVAGFSGSWFGSQQMTRRRLVLLLSGLGIMVALYFSYGAVHMYAMRRAWYWNIGTQLILTTNSPHLVALGQSLHSRLTEFLSSPATVESVAHGDAKAPIGDGTAMAHIILKNAKSERLGLRITRDDALRKDRVVGFWTPTPP